MTILYLYVKNIFEIFIVFGIPVIILALILEWLVDILSIFIRNTLWKIDKYRWSKNKHNKRHNKDNIWEE